MKGSRVSGAHRLRLDVVALSAVIVIAALVRFAGLDLMEFKADEAEACRLALHALGYSEPGIGRFFPTAEPPRASACPIRRSSSTSSPSPLAVVRSPLAVRRLRRGDECRRRLALLLAGTRYFSRFVGIASAALFALSPWAIVFFRKIWAPGRAAAVHGALLLALHAFLVERRRQAVFWLFVPRCRRNPDSLLRLDPRPDPPRRAGDSDAMRSIGAGLPLACHSGRCARTRRS